MDLSALPNVDIDSILDKFNEVIQLLFSINDSKNNNYISGGDGNGCDKYNVTCKATAVIEHKPFKDGDSDYFSSIDNTNLRGSNWRGYDCKL